MTRTSIKVDAVNAQEVINEAEENEAVDAFVQSLNDSTNLVVLNHINEHASHETPIPPATLQRQHSVAPPVLEREMCMPPVVQRETSMRQPVFPPMQPSPDEPEPNAPMKPFMGPTRQISVLPEGRTSPSNPELQRITKQEKHEAMMKKNEMMRQVIEAVKKEMGDGMKMHPDDIAHTWLNGEMPCFDHAVGISVQTLPSTGMPVACIEY